VIDLTPLAQLGVLLVRPGLLMISAPPFGAAYAPPHVKIGLTMMLAVALLPSIAVPQAANSFSLALVVLREGAIGLALGLSIRAFIAAVELAGHLSGFQIGLSYSAIVDPQSGVRNNLIATLYVNMALVIFLLTNGHHAFLRALNASYETLPIGTGHVGASLPATVVGLLGLVFALGTRLAAPLVLVLVVCEVGMALVARAAPMLNLMAIGAPARLIVGLLLLGLMAPVLTRMAVEATGTVLQLGVQGATAFR
jgi:flagellar biosynthetic protein FliR